MGQQAAASPGDLELLSPSSRVWFSAPLVGKPCKVLALASPVQKCLQNSAGSTTGQKPQKPSPTEGETVEICEKKGKAFKNFRLAFPEHGGKGSLEGPEWQEEYTELVEDYSGSPGLPLKPLSQKGMIRHR